ncbi:hypothetical protein GALL_161480 [mine drainage metagenome]|uniref:Uncharacterized protein n=1 Tax=mine drainage metagenome TaxID=410659 RepID=A0A1J5SP52_9ZZZZ
MTIFAILFVFASWIALVWHTHVFDAAALECLFTGLGFIAVVVTLSRGRKETNTRDIEHQRTLRALVLQSRLQVYQWQLQYKTENQDVLCRIANDYDRALRQLEQLCPLPGSRLSDEVKSYDNTDRK